MGERRLSLDTPAGRRFLAMLCAFVDEIFEDAAANGNDEAKRQSTPPAPAGCDIIRLDERRKKGAPNAAR